MRALPWIAAAALAALPAFSQQNPPRIPKPGPSPTSGSDAGPFSGLPDNTPPAPRVVLGIDSTPSPAIDALPNLRLRSAESVQQATDDELDRAEREHRRAVSQMNQAPVPINGAFTGQTGERYR